MMFLTADDIQEIRIFRSRLIRISERDMECPVYLRDEIQTIVTETINVVHQKTAISHIDNSILPIIRGLINLGIDIEKECFFDSIHYDRTNLNKFIEILGRL